MRLPLWTSTVKRWHGTSLPSNHIQRKPERDGIMVAGVIYAQKNSVAPRTLRSPLPAYVTLTSEEYKEALQFENSLSNNATKTFKVKETTNPGIWYVCLAKWEHIQHLLLNPALDKDILFLIINNAFYKKDLIVLSLLLVHPKVQNTVKLFVFTFEKYQLLEKDNPGVYNINFSMPLDENIGSFMHVLKACGTSQFSSPKIRAHYYNGAVSNQSKIVEYWKAQVDPDEQVLASLPFNWALSMLGYSDFV